MKSNALASTSTTVRNAHWSYRHLTQTNILTPLDFVLFSPVDSARAGSTDRIDLTQQDFAGTCSCTLHDVVQTKAGVLELVLGGGSEVEGSLTITAHVLNSARRAGQNSFKDSAVTRVEQKQLASRIRLYTLGCMFGKRRRKREMFCVWEWY